MAGMIRILIVRERHLSRLSRLSTGGELGSCNDHGLGAPVTRGWRYAGYGSLFGAWGMGCFLFRWERYFLSFRCQVSYSVANWDNDFLVDHRVPTAKSSS